MTGFYVTILDYKDKWAGQTIYIPERDFFFRDLIFVVPSQVSFSEANSLTLHCMANDC